MVNGIINVYKEKGFTSFDVVAKMRGIFHQKKIGHTGTLDPDAEGVLPVCLGRATRVCELLTDKDKEYRAVMLLGCETDTQDVTGKVLSSWEVKVTPQQVEETIRSFIGGYDQIPPMYSALKVNGQKLCNLARQGITVERQPRPVMIYDIAIEEITLPEVTMVVHCSKGTYIRTLCEDIGRKLGCGGCMKSLLRTRVSCFELADAWKLSDLEAWMDQGREGMPFLKSVDFLFLDLPSAFAAEEAAKLVENGNKLPVELITGGDRERPGEKENDGEKIPGLRDRDRLRLYDTAHGFVGIYLYLEEEQMIRPVKLFME